MPYHWTAKLTKTEIGVVKKFSCSPEWMEAFDGEENVVDLDAPGAPILLDKDIDGETEREALCSLEGRSYIWPLGDGKWSLDEYGLPIWLALNGIKSSCTIIAVN
jgi:hypothetical protein